MSSDNSKKTPLGQSLNQFASAKISDAVQNLGKALPATIVSVRGSIVKVNFEVQSGFTLPQLVLPKMESEWARAPTQPGDKGFVMSVDYYLGGMSGLGGGVAGLVDRGNLTNLVWFPCGNSGYQVVDGNAYVIYGPNGVVLRDKNSGAVVTLTPTSINLTVGGSVINVASGEITITGNLVINGIHFMTHKHPGVLTGGADTEGPVDG